MNWDDLRVFAALHRHGSLAAAGRELRLDATTVGRRLERLEHAVGAHLFLRTSDGLVPTAEGEALFEHADGMARTAARAARAVSGADVRLEGDVRIAATSSFASAFLVSHLAAFRRAHPGIRLVFDTGSQLVDLARAGVDVAVRFAPIGQGVPTVHGSNDVIATRVGRVIVSVYASADYLARRGTPNGAFEIAGHDVVLPRSGPLPGGPWFRRAEEQGVITLRIDTPEGLAAAAAAGFGFTALPRFIVAAHHPELVRIDNPDRVDERDAWVMVPAELRRVSRVRAVQQFLIDALAAWPALIASD